MKNKKRRPKDRLLISLAYISGFNWILCACLVDSTGLVGNIAFAGVIINGLWLGIFGYANGWFDGRW